MFKIPFLTEGLRNILKKNLTEEKDLTDIKAAEKYRGKLTFDKDLCIGCGLCMRVCAGNAITKKVETKEDGQEITMTFDMASCTFCGLCQDFCPKKSITLSEEYIMVEKDKADLKIQGSFFKKAPVKVPVKQKV